MATIYMPYVSNDAASNYQAKIQGYNTMGYNVIPQEQKYNGFETVKKYYEHMTGDGWAFENQFREPIKKYAGTYVNRHITVDQEISARINIMKQKIYKEI
jgi:hypothetical protein